MFISRLLAAGVVLAGAAIGLAGPASAEPLEGSYTATVVGGSMAGVHLPAPVIASGCGSDCTNLQILGTGTDLHPQSDTLTGTWPMKNGGTCAVSVNTQTLVMDQCGDTYQLTRN